MEVKPDLVLVAVVSWGAIKGSRQGALWGLLGGMILDLLASTPFGLHAITLVPVGLLGALGEHTLARDSLLPALIAVFVGSLAYSALIFAILQSMGGQGEWSVLLLKIALPAAILNTVLAPLVYGALELLSRLGRSHEVIAWEE